MLKYEAYQENAITFLVRQDTRHHLPGVKIYIIFQKRIKAVIARNFKFRSYS
jgi:hypothetical protein